MLAAVAAARRAPPARCECGAPLLWGSHFCANCGRPVGAEPVVACANCGHPLAGRRRSSAPAAGARRAPSATRTTTASRTTAPIPGSVRRAGEQDGRCPRCGTPYGEDQEYCLECGARLPSQSGIVGRLGVGLAAPVRLVPGRLDLAGARSARSRSPRPRARASRDLARRPVERRRRRRPSWRRLPAHERPEQTRVRDRREPTGTQPTTRDADRHRRRRPRPRPTRSAVWPAGQQRLHDRPRLDSRARAGARRAAARGAARAAQRHEAASASSTRRSSRASTPATSSSSPGSTALRGGRRARSSTPTATASAAPIRGAVTAVAMIASLSRSDKPRPRLCNRRP